MTPANSGTAQNRARRVAEIGAVPLVDVGGHLVRPIWVGRRATFVAQKRYGARARGWWSSG
eukprot:6222946-Prymnesium_polylepis.1